MTNLLNGQFYAQKALKWQYAWGLENLHFKTFLKFNYNPYGVGIAQIYLLRVNDFVFNQLYM